MLSLIIWTPIIAAILLLVAPIREKQIVRWFSLAVSLATLTLSCIAFSQIPTGGYEVRSVWFPEMGIYYHLALNRLSGLLVLLTTLVGTAALGISTPPKDGARLFYSLGLMMIGGMAGAFLSQDLLFLYVFHELALIPTFLLVGIWGGSQRRHAAMKITIYLGLGSLILLVPILGIYTLADLNTFDLIDLREGLAQNPIPLEWQRILFGLFLLGFGVLASIVPFHTWAPIGYAEAPPLASMLHAGVIKKFGLYGIFAVAVPLLPDGFRYWREPMLWLAVVNLVYCGYIAQRQRDLRYMIAYASVSHMGYPLLALAVAGFHSVPNLIAINGFMLFLFAHGVAAALAFASVGICRERAGTSEMHEMGGLAARMPFMAVVFSIAAFAASGLPGFANFPAELMIFFGSIDQAFWFTVAAMWTVVITATYYLRAIRSTFLGPLREPMSRLSDPGPATRFFLILLIAGLLWAGIFPQSAVGPFDSNTASVATTSRATQLEP
jgi:NADH-quinone oxidoreductase subunit M